MMDEELFSPYVVDILVREGVRPENVLLTACCDRSLDEEFEDTYVFLSIDRVSFLTVEYEKTVSKVYGGFISPKKGKKTESKEKVLCREKRYLEYRLSDIKEMRLVNLVASGVVYIRFEDEKKEVKAIAAYTNACVGEIAKISRAIQKIKEKGALNIAEFKDKDDEEFCPKCGRRYVNKQRKVCPKCANRKSTFARLLRMMPKYKKELWVAIFMRLIASACSLIMPYFLGVILFDKGLNPDSGFWYGKIGLIVLIIFGIYVMWTIVGAVQNIAMTRLSQNMVFDLKMDIFKAFQSMSMGFFTRNRIGSTMNYINSDSGSIANFFVSGIPYAVNAIISFVGGFVMLYLLNWRVLFLAAIPAFVIFVVLKSTKKYMWRMYQKSWAIGSKITSTVSDCLRGVKVVKAFGKEKDEISRFDKVNKKCFDVNYRMWNVITLLSPIYSLVISLVTYGIWIICGLQIVNGNTLMSYGILASTLSYFSMMLSPVESFSSFMEWWRNAMNAAQRMYDLIDIDPDVKESKTPVVMNKVRGDIDIANVTFGYEPNRAILKDINVNIKAGEMIGIVGHSGAGKSTLINLITRMYDADEGSISIDGYNVKDISIRTLRNNIALVTQDTYIFQGTVLENIAYGRPDASREEVIAAAKIARCHDFIEAMPEGYDTMVGAGYRSMSGGERQRVSIARAILINPRILILDEATAALDTETEMSIQDALDSLTEGRTTLAIAHRLSTLRNADRLVVIEDGEICEQGTHAELIKMKGVYYGLMLKQAEALKTKGV